VDNPRSFSDLLDIDRTLHEPARAAIMAVLYGVQSADFKFLLHMTQLTKGNLSAHARKLEKADFLVIKKSFRKNYPHTEYQLTQKGRTAFREYLKKLKALAKVLDV
jgi:DNA-binding MarR family transcriptional regulator